MDPNTSVLAQIASAFSGHHWLLLVAALSLYVRKIASPASKFPGMPNISPEWLSTISATGGLVYGLDLSLQSGAPVSTAILNCAGAAAASGFADGLLTAIFAHNSAPNWARFIVGIFDDVGSSGGTSKPAIVTPAVAAAAAFGVRKDSVPPPGTTAVSGGGVGSIAKTPAIPPPASKRCGSIYALFGVGLFAVALVACFPQQTPAQQEQAAEVLAACVSAHWGQPVLTIASACTSDVVPVAEDIIADIEAAVESSAKASDGGVVAFPYASDPNVAAKLVTAKMKIAHGAQ